MKAESTLQGVGLGQQHDPAFRVHYWTQPAADYAWNLDAWVLTDCEDVDEALSWARDNARGRRYQVFVVADSDPPLIVHLLGKDPNVAG